MDAPAAIGEADGSIDRATFLRRGAGALGAAALLANPLLLAACGGSSTDAARTASADGRPSRGGTFIYAIEETPAGLMPNFLTPGPSSFAIAAQLFSSLVAYDMDFEIGGELAESFEMSRDGRRWTFRLHPAARWHDGRPVTAADAIFTAEKTWPNASPTLVENVARYDAPDDKTFVIELRQPLGSVLASLTSLRILPKHVYDVPDLMRNPAFERPVGSGPFRFQEWRKGSHVGLVRNDDYYRRGLPHLDRVVIQGAVNPASRAIAFESGDIDFLHSYIVPFDRLTRWESDDRFTIVRGGLGVGAIDWLLFNLDNEILSDVDVRRAIAYALDRDELNEKGLFGHGKPGTSFLASVLPWYDASADVYQTNVDRANELLDAAGHPRGDDGKRFALRLDYANGRDFDDRIAPMLKSQLEAVGIDVTISVADEAAFTDKVFNGRDFDLAIHLWVTGPDPAMWTSRYLERYIGSRLGFDNAMGYVNKDLERLFEREIRDTDEARRKAAWAEAQRILLADLPLVPLVEMPNVQAHSARFQDLVTDAVWGYINQPRDEAHTSGT